VVVLVEVAAVLAAVRARAVLFVDGLDDRVARRLNLLLLLLVLVLGRLL
jgi:hypothetical protein